MRIAVFLALLLAACGGSREPENQQDSSSYGRNEPKPDADKN